MITAIIETGGKQFRVAEGDVIFVEKLDAGDGEKYTFDHVIAITDSGIKTGDPYVSGASVTGIVEKTGKAKKIIVYKMHSKKGYRRKQGHRQPYTRVRIETISA